VNVLSDIALQAETSLRSVSTSWAGSYFDRGDHFIRSFQRKKLAVNRSELDGRTVGRATAGAGWAAQQPRAAGYGLSHIPTHYADKAETEREARYVFTRWSAQRDRHGAFKRSVSALSA